MRRILVALLPILPGRARRTVARTLLGWEIDPTARIGRSMLDVRMVRMGPGSAIGPRNVIRGLEELTLEREAQIGGGNRISGFFDAVPAFGGDPARRSALRLGEYAVITTDHRIDCSDTVELEHHAVLAGFASVVLTHSVRPRTDTWHVAPVRIGHHSMVMTGCTVFTGVTIAPCVLVSASSVVASSLERPYTLYRGNPAVAERELDESYRLLDRPGDYGTGGDRP